MCHTTSISDMDQSCEVFGSLLPHTALPTQLCCSFIDASPPPNTQGSVSFGVIPRTSPGDGVPVDEKALFYSTVRCFCPSQEQQMSLLGLRRGIDASYGGVVETEQWYSIIGIPR